MKLTYINFIVDNTKREEYNLVKVFRKTKYLEDEVMLDLENMLDLFLDNVKKLFFPEEWLELDLKFSKYELFTILLLNRRQETTMTELVEYINSPMSTATGIVDRLVKSGYVKRERSETDRRIVILSLTEEGTQLVQKLKDLISKYLNLVLEDLTEEEKKFMTGIAFKVMNKLQQSMTAPASMEYEEHIKKIDIE